MFILGLMYEFGRGVNQNIPKALDLFDRAGSKGQGYARMAGKGMRTSAAAAINGPGLVQLDTSSAPLS
jgi:TPR repeat protein